MPGQIDHNRKKDLLVKFAYAAVAFAIYYLIFRYVIYIAWPFAIALLVAVATRRPTLFVSKKLHLPEKWAAALVTLIFYLLFAGILVLVVLKAVFAVIDWSQTLPTLYDESIAPALEEIFEWIRSFSSSNSENASYLANVGDSIIKSLDSVIAWVSGKAVIFAKTLALGVPKTILGALFMVVSNFYIAIDYDRISRFFMAQFSPNQQQIIVSSKEYLGKGIFGLIGSYLLLMLITFVELNIGLRILGVNNATIVALVIAIFDLMPVLGTGGIVIPWFIIEFVIGNTRLGLGLLVMYAIITVIRNVIEPKIVGDSIGIHPVLLLVSLYLGAWLLGPLGIVILPFSIIIIRKLNDAGLISIFKTPNEEV